MAKSTSVDPKWAAKVARVKTRLHKEGSSLKAWATERGVPYSLVTDVTKGKNKATFGKGYEVAVALGLKEAA